jgi:hypothetical protein
MDIFDHAEPGRHSRVLRRCCPQIIIRRTWATNWSGVHDNAVAGTEDGGGEARSGQCG